MKKILCMAISVFLVMTTMCQMHVLAISVDDIKIAESLSYVDVTATTTAGGTMTVRLTGENNKVYGVYSSDTPADVDGKKQYSFYFKIPDAASTGTYTVSIRDSISDSPVEKAFKYVTLDDKKAFYSALEAKGEGEATAFLNSDTAVADGKPSWKKLVPVDVTEYALLDGAILEMVNDYVVGVSFDISQAEGVTDAEKVAHLEEIFKEIFNKAMAMASLAIVEENEWENVAKTMLLSQNANKFDNKYYIENNTTEVVLSLADSYQYYAIERDDALLDFTFAAYSDAFDRATLRLIAATCDFDTYKEAFLYFEEQGSIAPTSMVAIDALINAGVDVQLWRDAMTAGGADCDELIANTVRIAQTMYDRGDHLAGGNNSNINPGPGTTIDRPSAPSGSGTSSGGSSAVIKPVTPSATGTFVDVAKTHWACEPIEALAKDGILNGKGDGLFAPEASVTREEFVKIIVSAFELESDAEKCDFSDVSEDDWSYSYIAVANDLGIVTGDGETFNPAAQITRQDMAVIIYRVFELFDAEVSGDAMSFDDASEISNYAKEAVETLTGAGVLNGMGNGIFAPKTSVTRAQAAKVVYSLLDLIGGGK